MRQLQIIFSCWLVALLLWPVSLKAHVWSADDIPMVHLEDRNRYVCDPDGFMSPAARDSADYYLRRLHTECGIQTVFIVAGRVKDGDCFRMAQDVGNRYGVGTKKDRRGLVVVIAVDDHSYFIAPGKGLEGDLTDVECNDIGQACIVSNMKADNTDMAVLSTSKALFSKFKTGSSGVASEEDSEEMSLSDYVIIGLVLLIFFGLPTAMFVRLILIMLGIIKPPKSSGRNRHFRWRDHDDDGFPPFFIGGGGFGGGGGSIGGSFGGGSFGGGGAGGKW